MDRVEFQILTKLMVDSSLTQREWARELNISLGKVNKVINNLKSCGYINEQGKITQSGIKALQPYHVDNAIIMAAGMSSRFAPISFERPKGLLKVKGQILIERQIEQLKEAGIHDITVVVGYMKEMFFYLKEKYAINIIINEEYQKYNNPSTLMLVKKQLKNTYICSCDDYFSKNVFEPYVYQSYYAAKYAEGYTDEYCMNLRNDGRIQNVSIGGSDSWYMLGHVYFSKQFSERFVPILEQEYQNENSRKLLWEQLYMKYIDELDMYVRKYEEEDIYEFDSLDELRQFDEYYINNTDSRILKNICKVFSCQEKDIINIIPLKQGMTNLSFGFSINDKKYVYRHPGVGTEEYIDRKSEAFSMIIAKELALDDSYLYMDEEGWKISNYIEDARYLDYHNTHDVKEAISIMKKLHNQQVDSKYTIDIWDQIAHYINRAKKRGRLFYNEFENLYESIEQIYEYAKRDVQQVCLCHNDCYSSNFLIDNCEKMYLVDWEYSGMADAGVDLGTFISCSDYSYDEALDVLRLYHGDLEMTETELRHNIAYVAIMSFYWFVWGVYQECNGNVVGQDLMTWYQYSNIYAKKAIDLYMTKGQ